jgi:hypothetical protein
MTENPEQVLIQQHITTRTDIEERRISVTIRQDHEETGCEYRQH